MDTQQEERVDLILHFGTFPAKSHHSPWVLLLLEKPNRNIPVLALKRLFLWGVGNVFICTLWLCCSFPVPFPPHLVQRMVLAWYQTPREQMKLGMLLSRVSPLPGLPNSRAVDVGALYPLEHCLGQEFPQPLVLLTLTAGLAQ